VYALSNWSAETFPFAEKRFPFLKWFDGIMLSGKVGLVKPDPRLFQLFLDSFFIDPSSAVFVDDLKHNVEAAEARGLQGIVFTAPNQLRRELAKVGLLAIPRGTPGPQTCEVAVWLTAEGLPCL